MKFGIHLGTVNPRFWGDVAEEADRLGFESLWGPEHVVVPLSATGSPPRGSDPPPIPSDVPVYDGLGVLAHLAARTSRIRLGTHVYNIGLRHPFLTARAATTVDVLSGGRLNLGIGASWLRSEWEAMGLDFDTRGARVDEAIHVCRRLWTDAVIEHHGTFFDFGPTAFEPKPVQQPLALHIGGDRAAARPGAGPAGCPGTTGLRSCRAHSSGSASWRRRPAAPTRLRSLSPAASPPRMTWPTTSEPA